MSELLPESIANRVVVLGRIRTAVGLAGWLKIQSFTDPPDNILKYQTWQLGTGSGPWRSVKLKQHRWSGNELHVLLNGVTERNSAEQYRNLEIGVMRRELPAPAQGEFYWDDLLGLFAVLRDGTRLGQIDHFVDSPAHPYMVLRGVDGQGKQLEHFVPVVKGRVQKVDFENRIVELDWTLDWN
jgi:16S rRNA processing protein RimM